MIDHSGGQAMIDHSGGQAMIDHLGGRAVIDNIIVILLSINIIDNRSITRII